VLSNIVCPLRVITNWADAHSGLGSWAGALGAVLAIFVAWFLARHEYRRSEREAAVRRTAEIDLICRIISDFEALLNPYIDALRAGSQAQLVGFYNQHLNDPECHSMIDLAHLLVTQWPSLAEYASFKQYWFASTRILETSNVNSSKIDLSKALSEHDARLKDLNAALQIARR
jgi:hypothetical protein